MVQPPLILIVDDESHIVNVLSVRLQHEGFRVVAAGDGRAALDVALRDQPDLVITDFQMPRLNGVELSLSLMRNAETANTPVILLTARSHTINHNEPLCENIKAMIGKPFSPRDVLKKVHELLGDQVDPQTEVSKAS